MKPIEVLIIVFLYTISIILAMSETKITKIVEYTDKLENEFNKLIVSL